MNELAFITPLPRKNMHCDWHWQWAAGNSELGNNGPHQLDICRWGLRKNNMPQSVFSFGGRYGYVDDGETPNTHVVLYDYDLNQVYQDMEEHLQKHGIDMTKEQIIIGKKLTMDSKTEYFTGYNSAMANLFVKDTYREPFVIPDRV